MPLPEIDKMNLNDFPPFFRERLAADRVEASTFEANLTANKFSKALLLYKAEDRDESVIVFAPYPVIPNPFVTPTTEGDSPLRLQNEHVVFGCFHHIPKVGERMILPSTFMEYAEDVNTFLMDDFCFDDDVTDAQKKMFCMEVAGRTMRYLFPCREGKSIESFVQYSLRPQVGIFVMYLASKGMDYPRTQEFVDEMEKVMMDTCVLSNVESYRMNSVEVFNAIIGELKDKFTFPDLSGMVPPSHTMN